MQTTVYKKANKLTTNYQMGCCVEIKILCNFA